MENNILDLDRLYPNGYLIEILGRRRAILMISGHFTYDELFDSLPSRTRIVTRSFHRKENYTKIEILLHGSCKPLK